MITAPLFLVPHNWEDPAKRKLSWKTDILVPQNGAEQRRRLRTNPIETLTYKITFTESREEVAFRGMLWNSPDLRIALPRWEDAMVIADPGIAIGDTVIPTTLPVSNRQLVGDAVIYWEGNGYEQVVVQSAVGNVITLAAGTTQAWPSGVVIVPLVQGRVTAPVQSEEFGQLKGNITLEVVLEEDIAGLTTDIPAQPMVPASISGGSEAVGQEGSVSRGDVQALIFIVQDAAGNIIPDPDIVMSGYDASRVEIYPTGQPGVWNFKNVIASGGGGNEPFTATCGSVVSSGFYIPLD